MLFPDDTDQVRLKAPVQRIMVRAQERWDVKRWP